MSEEPNSDHVRKWIGTGAGVVAAIAVTATAIFTIPVRSDLDPEPSREAEVPVAAAVTEPEPEPAARSRWYRFRDPVASVPATDAYEVDAAMMAKARLAVAEKYAPKLATDIQPIEIIVGRATWVLLQEFFAAVGLFVITAVSMTPEVFLIVNVLTDSGHIVKLRGRHVGLGTIHLVATDDYGFSASVAVPVYVSAPSDS